MRQAGAVLRLVPSGTQTGNGLSLEGPDLGARSGTAPGNGRAGSEPADASARRDPLQNKGLTARGARHDLLKEWMGSHMRILGLWLDRLMEEGDDADLVSMIHRQHAWLCMMQDRMNHG